MISNGEGKDGNHGTSENKSSHVELSWRLDELVEEAVTIEVGAFSRIVRLVVRRTNFCESAD